MRERTVESAGLGDGGAGEALDFGASSSGDTGLERKPSMPARNGRRRNSQRGGKVPESVKGREKLLPTNRLHTRLL